MISKRPQGRPYTGKYKGIAYSDAIIKEARRQYYLSGNLTAIAVAMSLPREALKYWRQRGGWGTAYVPTGSRPVVHRWRCQDCRRLNKASPCATCGNTPEWVPFVTLDETPQIAHITI